jgi:hypothetical protein
MPITYTNRKGSTYYLCQAVTKTGKQRHFFAREPKDTPVEEIPAGYEVEESINGIVSLVKVRPQLIFPEELASVQSALKKNPKGRHYQAANRDKQIIIYESQVADFAGILAQIGWSVPASIVQDFSDRHAQFSPIMRFILNDSEDRIFIPQRWCFRGSIDDWINVVAPGKIDVLAEELIPILGTDEFFELY